GAGLGRVDRPPARHGCRRDGPRRVGGGATGGRVAGSGPGARARVARRPRARRRPRHLGGGDPSWSHPYCHRGRASLGPRRAGPGTPPPGAPPPRPPRGRRAPPASRAQRAARAVTPGPILFYCQHLLGLGHLERAARLARALGRAGEPVIFVQGGRAVPRLDLGGAEVVALPPLVAADAAASAIAGPDGRRPTPEELADRRDRL